MLAISTGDSRANLSQPQKRMPIPDTVFTEHARFFPVRVRLFRRSSGEQEKWAFDQGDLAHVAGGPQLTGPGQSKGNRNTGNRPF